MKRTLLLTVLVLGTAAGLAACGKKAIADMFCSGDFPCEVASDLTSTLELSAMMPSLRALEEGKEPKPDAQLTECATAADAYLHGALKFFNGQLCVLNVHFTGIAEEALYKLVVEMGLDPDVATLADDGTAKTLDEKVVGDKTITGTVLKVVAPDSFQGVYDYKAEVKLNDTVFVVLYWSGKGAESKGFLIKGGVGFREKAEALYIRWDRTTEAQSVQVMGTRIGSGTYATNGQLDRAIFGEAVFNKTTKAVTVQMTEIGPTRGAASASTAPACWMMYGSGIKGGAIVMNKTDDSYNASGLGNPMASDIHNGTSDAGVDGGANQMDRAELNDDPTVANGAPGTNFDTASGVAMKYSCADLDGADASGQPFFGNTVNFAMTKTQADAMFAQQP